MKRSTFILCSIIAVCALPIAHAHAKTTKEKTIVVRKETILDKEDFHERNLSKSSVRILKGKQNSANVAVTSWKDLPFKTVKRQALDYSCGSAAVSTLLTHIYKEPTSEGSVFKAMFKAGDKKKIRKEGFSLLDMSKYLNKRGYKAIGYKVSLKAIEKTKAPFIALVNNDGYNHFVVVKSIKEGYVLVGDPSKGNVIYQRDKFKKMWNGIALLVTNHAEKARHVFHNKKEWSYARSLARPGNANEVGVDRAALSPIPWQVAPSGFDALRTPLTSLQ